MKFLEELILEKGKFLPGDILVVNSFFNQQISSKLMQEIGKEISRLYGDCGITKIFTAEASGIAFATVASLALGADFVFAKKKKSSNVVGECYESCCHSFTHGNDYTLNVPKDFINKNDTVLIIDDFLATGSALEAMTDIVGQAGAKLAGICIGIEKKYQNGGKALREKGIRIDSLAMIESFNDGKIVFGN